MKAMYIAFAATVVIAVLAPFVLSGLGFSSQDRAAGTAVRLGDATE